MKPDIGRRLLHACLLRNLLEATPIKWKMFDEAFNDEYFLDRVHFKMGVDFLSLSQGDKFVVEYEERRTTPSHFTTRLVKRQSLLTFL